MKKLFTLFIAFTLISCNDGNFDIPDFEFSETVNNCGEYTLYRTNDEETEVIILTLTPSNLGTTEGEKNIDISSSVSVVYRIFDSAIGTAYFCQDIPPSTPNVLKDIIAESGSIKINTTPILAGTEITGYTYSIVIEELLFNDDKERIYFESFDFGELEINL